MDEIKICVNMKKNEYKKQYRALKRYTSFRLGQNILILSFILGFGALGCRYTGKLIGSRVNPPKDMMELFLLILVMITCFVCSFMFMVKFFQAAIYKDYFMNQNADHVSYTALFGTDKLMIFSQGAEAQPVILEYRECGGIFNCIFGIAIYSADPKQKKLLSKYFFPKNLFTKTERAVIKEWQKEYLYQPPIFFEKILKE